MNPPDRITPPGWMSAEPTRRVMAALGNGGKPARFVGGCVRDAILGLEPADIDLATPEEPAIVIRLLERAKLRVIQTGIAHGTVTAVVPPITFQITSLRRDLATDGRHAVVAFGTDWREDALRRDFTINALYADPDGTIHDFTDGRADLAAGIVRFIGDPGQRIAEDHLRLLRFFRFHARFARGAPDAASLAACSAAAELLGHLSGERIRDELMKIIGLPDPVPVLGLMHSTGVLAVLLPDATFDPGRLARLIDLQGRLSAATGIEADPWLRLAAMHAGGVAGQAERLADRLRLSAAQRLHLAALVDAVLPGWEKVAEESSYRRMLYQAGVERCRGWLLLAASQDPDRTTLALQRAIATATWQRPVFPLRGADILAVGFSPSPTVSALLGEIEEWWLSEDFRPDRAACLQRLQMRVAAPAESPQDDGGEQA